MKKNRINWRNTLFLTLTPLAAAIMVPWYFSENGFNWTVMAILASFYVIFTLSIGCGYHRYFAHRSYEVHPIIEFLYVFFGSGSFQGSVLEWSADHRIHHSKVDTDQDPYSINKGFWYAHIGWLFVKSDEPMDFPKDLASKKLLQFQHKYYGLCSTVVGFGVPWLVGELCGVGIGGFIFGGVLRVVLTQHTTFMVNSVAHTFGTQPYSQEHTARDSFLLAVLTFGEGYHNYHHEFQSDYRCAVKWYQWDPSKWTISTLSFVGLAKKLKRFSRYDVAIVKVRQESNFLIMKGHVDEKLQNLRQGIEDAQKRAKFMMAEYQREYQQFKANMQEQSHEKIAQLKADMKKAQQEFEVGLKQWRLYMKSLKKARIYG